MASLFPIIAVLILSIYVSQTISVEEIINVATLSQSVITESSSIWTQTPYAEIRGGVQAISSVSNLLNDCFICYFEIKTS